MKKFITLFQAVLAAVLMAEGAAMADPFSDFKKYAAESYLKPFAKDFGGLIGGADFHTGRTAGFPGFDVGIAGVVQSKPSSANTILKTAGVDAFGLALLQGSVGLPVVDADLTVRGVTYSDLTIVGGGLRYGLLKSGTLTKFIPDVSVSVFYDAINYTYFKGSHMSVDAAASLDIPVVKPFAGIGYDRTKLEVKGVGAALDGTTAAVSAPRYTLGLKLVPFPLTYVFAAYSILHGQAGYQAGLGIKF
ncbi:MAG: hypothetical protein A2X28_02465 [Elusimicrobia bacterium GWA2_56_46]|nr:MAG: hypothetical protein A2X28_02465 [Elusimicrobia bacterium GWA2_56_46]OGR55374.1 MAG: hypothetical protein A2X39_00500 [Elusimicrobia bacterium GWC2_56_31]HBB68161.1 hypothetical protein [Elusimicrobiota bacterium]HBW21833.1 hypothetical protein [Elusimicrobiota bacterium]